MRWQIIFKNNPNKEVAMADACIKNLKSSTYSLPSFIIR